jgi:hypothetical protein
MDGALQAVAPKRSASQALSASRSGLKKAGGQRLLLIGRFIQA